VAAELECLLREPSYDRRAADVGSQIRAEDGAGAACDAIETFLRKGTRLQKIQR